MRSLVTGATGFIGSHVAEILKARGHTVRLLVRNEKRLYPELKQGYDIVKGDVTQSPADLAAAVRDVDYVFHIAGLIKARRQIDYNRVNSYGTRNLLNALRESKSEIMRFVLCSSLAAVGPCDDSRHVVNEDSLPHPITYYGRSKLLGEKFAREFMADFPITIIRPPGVYGPRDTAILEFFKWMSRGYNLQFGEDERVFSMIHGRDLARGIVESAMHESTVGETFFLTDLEPYHLSWTMELLRDILKPSKRKMMKPPLWIVHTYAQIIDALQVILRRPLLPNSDKIRELMPLYWVCSGQKAKDTFGFQSEIPIKEGMKETADWYLKNGWIKVK
jgi:nucleoside-diphosphate-sugar epimerase